MTRPVVDETLCFVCQKNKPEFTAMRGKELFDVCKSCSELIEQGNREQNAMKSALFSSRGGDILRMTLGADLLPVRISIKEKK